MRVDNFVFKSIEELKDFKFNVGKNSLVQIFSGFSSKDDIKKIQEVFKDIDFIGVTTAGEIKDKAFFNSIVVSVVEFDNAKIKYGYAQNENEEELGEEIAKKVSSNLMILFLSGLTHKKPLNPEDVIVKINELKPSLIVSGGVAGDNGQFVDTFVFTKDKILSKGAVFAEIDGSFEVYNDYELNWQSIGKVMEVTKVEKNRLFEVNGMKVKDLYELYLGKRVAKGLPLSASEFPLIKLEDDVEICRSFPYMFEDGSFLTIGNLYKGDKVKFSFGNVELIINETKDRIPKKLPFKPEAIFIYSCAGRLAFLQSNIEKELEIFNNIAPSVGFFTYGEVMHKNSKNYLLNYSLTYLALAEKREPLSIEVKDQTKSQNLFEEKEIIVLDALTHLSNRVIEELLEEKKKVEELNRHTQEAIRYASLIQHALLAEEKEMNKIFSDKFVFWLPRDVVGGDIWGFDILDDSEALLMIIDCTGHGVPGALVTMLVKSFEKEIVEKIKEQKNISTSEIMQFFNREMKKLLRQYDNNSQSNVGFDGALLYYNKKNNILKFTGANLSMFLVNEDKVEVIKGDRYSVGYKNCDENYQYKEVTLEAKKGMKIYFSTDGYIDQIGGEKELPFGKKRFKKIIQEYSDLPMPRQKEIFIQEFLDYKGDEEQNDDITVIGVEL